MIEFVRIRQRFSALFGLKNESAKRWHSEKYLNSILIFINNLWTWLLPEVSQEGGRTKNEKQATRCLEMDSRVGQGCSLWADPGSRKMAFLIINQALCEMWETEGLPRTVGNRRFSMVRHFHQGKKPSGRCGNVYSHFHQLPLVYD